MWAGLCGNSQVLGTFVLDGNVILKSNLEVMNIEIVILLVILFPHQFQDVQFQRLWWAQRSVPAHQIIIVRHRVNHVFQNRVVILFSDNEWPPRSPDFFLGVYIKCRNYSSPPPTLKANNCRIL